MNRSILEQRDCQVMGCGPSIIWGQEVVSDDCSVRTWYNGGIQVPTVGFVIKSSHSSIQTFTSLKFYPIYPSLTLNPSAHKSQLLKIRCPQPSHRILAHSSWKSSIGNLTITPSTPAQRNISKRTRVRCLAIQPRIQESKRR